MLPDNSKPEKFSRSGPVKFNEKWKIDNSITNHPYSFRSNTHHLDKVFGLIRAFLMDN